MADDIETLAESERALLAKAGDHHPETCDCSVYAEDGGYPEHDICTGLSETFAAVETILTSRTTSSGRPSNERDGECICNYGPDTDGPDECCPFHGRPYSYWVDAVGELTARHDADIAAAKAAGAAESQATIVTLRDAYREAIGVPESQHQRERMERLATALEAALAEVGLLRAALTTGGEGRG